MKKTTKLWLLIAAALTVLGSLLFVGVMTAYGWDFTKLSTVTYETVTHDIEAEFHSASIETETADIRLLPSEDGKCKVICHQEEKVKYNVAVKDGVLEIRIQDNREWYDYIGIYYDSPAITVYLPEKDYRTLSVIGSTGDIRMEEIAADSVTFSLATGDITLSRLSCRNMTAEVSTGDVELKNVIASEKISIETSTGDVELDSCDGGEIVIETSTGDVEGSLLTGKEFIAETSTGDVEVPKNSAGGRCEITTSTGDIEITVE